MVVGDVLSVSELRHVGELTKMLELSPKLDGVLSSVHQPPWWLSAANVHNEQTTASGIQAVGRPPQRRGSQNGPFVCLWQTNGPLSGTQGRIRQTKGSANGCRTMPGGRMLHTPGSRVRPGRQKVAIPVAGSSPADKRSARRGKRFFCGLIDYVRVVNPHAMPKSRFQGLRNQAKTVSLLAAWSFGASIMR